MTDLVGTCPKDFWEEWIAEGDAAGSPDTGEEWAWFTNDRKATSTQAGDRFYVVAHGRLRGYAPVVSVERGVRSGWMIIRRGGAVACTIPDEIPGFRGLRKRWWHRDCELQFPDWKTSGVPVRRGRAA